MAMAERTCDRHQRSLRIITDDTSAKEVQVSDGARETRFVFLIPDIISQARPLFLGKSSTSQGMDQHPSLPVRVLHVWYIADYLSTPAPFQFSGKKPSSAFPRVSRPGQRIILSRNVLRTVWNPLPTAIDPIVDTLLYTLFDDGIYCRGCDVLTFTETINQILLGIKPDFSWQEPKPQSSTSSRDIPRGIRHGRDRESMRRFSPD